MPKIIFDNCTLSNFALSNSLHIIKKLYANYAYITDFAAAENIRGINNGYTELTGIKEAILAGWLKETALERPEEKALFETLSISLGFGEASSIAIAKIRSCIFACDDKAARKEAALPGVKLTGTIGILIKAVNKKIVDLEVGNKILKSMVSCGFYSPINTINKDLL